MLIKGLRQKAGIATDAPADWVAAGTVWRCMNHQVWACFVGANLPCSEKADTQSTPQAALTDFCKSNPQVESIPAAVTGRATVYTWRCVNGAPQADPAYTTPDASGFLPDIWYVLEPQ